jgi:predicted transcriptional regulator
MHRTSARSRHLARTLTIEIRSTADALDAFRGTFRALAAGERRVTVAGVHTAWNLLTRNRLALLRAIRAQHPGSMEELARALGRDLKGVRHDLRTLEEYGLIRTSLGPPVGKRRVPTPKLLFDEIVLKITI